MRETIVKNLLPTLISNKEEFFHYLRAKYPLFHNSNFFFRDLQFGIKGYFEKKEIYLSYSESENLARMFSEQLIDENLFIKTSPNSWKINNLNYITKESGDPF